MGKTRFVIAGIALLSIVTVVTMTTSQKPDEACAAGLELSRPLLTVKLTDVSEETASGYAGYRFMAVIGIALIAGIVGIVVKRFR